MENLPVSLQEQPIDTHHAKIIRILTGYIVLEGQLQHTIEHLFRHESGKLISVLTRLFGPHNLCLAEDVVQDTLLKAMDYWKFNGIPDNPSAWLFTVARNKALDVIRKEGRHRQFASGYSHLLESEYSLVPTLKVEMKGNDIEDDQLRMIFTCCHPQLPPESQLALVLKTLCGFSIPEIAKAFLTSNDTIEKRLYRARQEFRTEKIAFEIPGKKEIQARLNIVLSAIYLLFNEGYNSTRNESLIRNDLLAEAARLCTLMIHHPSTRHPDVFALMALMCFTNARNAARTDPEGNILLLQHQDRNLWNHQLVNEGIRFLEKSASGTSISRYHLEAGIAREYMLAPDFKSTNWKNILHYYDMLFELQSSPVVALNRAIVIAEINGPAAGIEAINHICDLETLGRYYLLPATLGELHDRLQESEKAKAYYERAIELTQSDAEKKLLRKKILAL